MKNITYYSASAGSGKTYTLTHCLADLIEQHKGEDYKIILTTFSKKAAVELKEKAQDVLYEKGLYDEASLLEDSLIGTNHSVFLGLINQFWYYLGISPDNDIIEPEEIKRHIKYFIPKAVSEEDVIFFQNFKKEFNIQSSEENTYNANASDYIDELKKIMDCVVNFDVPNLSYSRRFSLDLIEKIFEKPYYIGDRDIDKECFEIQQEVLQNILNGFTTTDKRRREKIDELKTTINNRTVNWYYKLFNVILAAGRREETKENQDVKKNLETLFFTNTVKEFFKEYVDRIFNIGDKCLNEFRQYKEKNHLISFGDMEKYMLDLLKKEDVKQQIKNTYKCIFVDEFQDSSPIQIKIFKELSDLLEKSIWVGDKKQSIYGFRGTDTWLVDYVTDELKNLSDKQENGCCIKNLSTSYRSLPELVDLTNVVAARKFGEEAKLKKHRQGEGNILCWPFKDKEEFAGRIASFSKEYIGANGKQLKDIAVLVRRNDDVKQIATLLSQKYNMPLNCHSDLKLTDYKETQLIIALLSLLVNRHNAKAKAQTAYLTQKDNTLSALLQDRFDYINKNKNEENGKLRINENNYLKDIPLIKNLEKIRDNSYSQSVSALVETVIIELDLYNVVLHWGYENIRHLNLEHIAAMAKKYEQICLSRAEAATINGFISYLSESDEPASGDPEGINVLTYHKAKGLEWPVTILSSLDFDRSEDDQIRKFFGANFYREPSQKEGNNTKLYREALIRVLPWPFGRDKSVKIQNIKDNIRNHKAFKQVLEDFYNEEARIIYVGITRAKDYLILAEQEKTQFGWFKNIGVESQKLQNGIEQADILNTQIPFKVLWEYNDIGEFSFENKPRPIILHKQEQTDYKDRNIDVSKIESATDFKLEIIKNASQESFIKNYDFLNRMTMDELGNCIHQIFSLFDYYDTVENNLFIQIIKDYGLENSIDLQKIIDSWNTLKDFIRQKYGYAIKLQHETPYKYFDEKTGNIYEGRIDLLWQTQQGYIVIDYKTTLGNTMHILDKNNKVYAGKYVGQINNYAEALRLAGKTVLAKLLYYADREMIIEIK